MRRNPGIAVTRMLGLSASLLGLLLALALPAAPSALAAGDVNDGTCPNEANTGFTSALPDCRAYEQVSPTFKNGFEMTVEHALPEGERVQGFSVGLFAGATSGFCATGSSYDSARTELGWTTTAINDAPLTELEYAGGCAVLLLNGEGASLLELRPIAGSVYARDLYIHEPGPDGAFVPVGPMIPPSAIPPSPTGTGPEGGFQNKGLIDATSDFKHVLFVLDAQSQYLAPGITSELWPGDTTHLQPEQDSYAPSLYEYAGTNNTAPTLVGVDNSGHLISDCGTALGGYGLNNPGNDLNSLSEDGSHVVFTAIGATHSECAGLTAPSVDELFVRINGDHTVAISEPNALASAPPDEGCTEVKCRADITEPANFRDANYEKASRNGSKIFFTSTQRLLNNATQDSDAEDSAVPQLGEKGCDGSSKSLGTMGPNGCNLYEYDLEENPVTKQPFGLSLVSGGDSSGLGPEVQGVAAVSEDGSHIYFVAKGVLTREPRGDKTGACIAELTPAELAVEEETKEGRCRPKREADNLYVRDTETGETEFIATLSEADNNQWLFNAEGAPMNVTDNGGFLVFTSTEHLTTGDASTVRQVFRYEAATGALVRISLGNKGHDGLGASSITSRGNTALTEAEELENDSHPAVSEDGSIVVFASTEALVPQAPTNNQCEAEEGGKCVSYFVNTYEYRGGHVYLIADGNEPSLSRNGRDIFFSTAEPLVVQDGDHTRDIYDAREDGGFASSVPASCREEGCQGLVGAEPVFGAPSSASVTGGGNLALPTPVAPKPKPKAKPLTRAQKLTKALKLCHAKHDKKARTSCESTAHRKYGLKAKKSSSDRRSGR
jgi:hypothetical protein